MNDSGTKQYALWLFRFTGDDIHQPVHAVAEIDVDHTAFPIEQFRAGCSPFGGMTRQIFLPAVGFGFGNAFL